MKTNATARIIIWSIILVLLLGILCGGLFLRRNGIVDFRRTEVPTETVIPVRIEETFPENLTYTAEQITPVYATPNGNDTPVDQLTSGETVSVIRHELVGGDKWALFEGGWIRLDDNATVYLIEPEIIDISTDPGEKHTVSSAGIREISIEWVAGDILIQPGNVDAITFSEDDGTDPKYALVYQTRGDELNISFCKDTLGKRFDIHSINNISKDLTVTVPKDWVCQSLDIDAASATVEINDMTIREMDFDGASGTCELENCTVGEMDINTASGDITIIGTLDSLDCDAASASVYAVLSNIPSRLDMDSMSGSLDITLPEDAGFTLNLGGLSTEFTSDFDTTVKNGNHVCGTGACRINIEALSGDVTIRKGERSGHHEEAHIHTETCTRTPESCPDNAAHHTDPHHS